MTPRPMLVITGVMSLETKDITKVQLDRYLT